MVSPWQQISLEINYADKGKLKIYHDLMVEVE